MTDVLTRVRQLIALAGSPYEQEARTSANLACKLIREHGFIVTDVGCEPPRQDPWPSGDPIIQYPPFMVGGAAEAIARSPVVCFDCKALIGEGNRLWWRPGIGGVHLRCNPNILYRHNWYR